MFYQTGTGHSLPKTLAHDPFKAMIAPRPIGWISTLDTDGTPNLAPYSFFNAVSDSPKILMFASGGIKDSAKNALDTGEFTFNFVSSTMRDGMNRSSKSYEHGVSEFEKSGLEQVPGQTVACPRVKGVAAAFECKTLEPHQPTTLSGEKADYVLILGEVTGIFIDDACIADGRFDLAKADPIMRAGYRDYMSAGGMFELTRPDDL
ncbi:MAG: flavin reductase family protein [Pseudomonadota bacterium]